MDGDRSGDWSTSHAVVMLLLLLSCMGVWGLVAYLATIALTGGK
jgi:hypothetical protein